MNVGWKRNGVRETEISSTSRYTITIQIRTEWWGVAAGGGGGRFGVINIYWSLLSTARYGYRMFLSEEALAASSSLDSD